MSSYFDEYIKPNLVNEEYRAEYHARQPEYAIIHAITETRLKKGLTQKELSELSGITQSDISRLEKGKLNPTISTLQRLARAMGMYLRIEFVPENDMSDYMDQTVNRRENS